MSQALDGRAEFHGRNKSVAVECSIVVPLRNEETRLAAVHLRLTAVMRQLAIPYEIIYVDNGSDDRTAEVIAALNEQDGAVRGLILSRQFSAEAALCAGLEASDGRAVVSFDNDLAGPPTVVTSLIESWCQGHEVVSAFPRRRQGTLGRIAGTWTQRLVRMFSEIPLGDDAAALTLMDRRVVEEFNNLPERTRFLSGLRRWVGFRHAVVEYDRRLHLDNTRGNRLRQRTRSTIETLFAFSNLPLKLIAVAGFLITGLALGVMVGGLRIAGGEHMPLLLMGCVLGLVGGIQLISAGILGEYLARVYREVRGRPLYVTRRRVGFRPHPQPVRNVVQFRRPVKPGATQSVAEGRPGSNRIEKLTAHHMGRQH